MIRTGDISGAPAITIRQPWAAAVALSLKRYETRSWAVHHRGPILIHAGKRWTGTERAFWHATGPRLLIDFDGVAFDQQCRFDDAPALGCVVAVADLVECWPADRAPGLTPLERRFGDFTPGRFAWQLENAVRLASPVPCPGRQGLWRPSAGVVDAVRDQLRGAIA